MEKSLNLSIYLPIFLSFSLNGQVSNSQEKEENVGIKLNSIYNLEEIKVRWKKVALENCPVVPCIIIPPPPPPPSFTCGTSTISDLDGNIYNTVLIGTQCWTKQNLKVTKYNDGSNIPEIPVSGTWNTTIVTGARTVYADLPANLSTYGYLYNWYAANDVKKICPTGWHVPTDPEWTSLEIQLGGSAGAGGKMKQQGDVSTSPPGLWNFPNTGADNLSGFTALPGGFRNFRGSVSINLNTFFWSNTSSLSDAISRSLEATNSRVGNSVNSKYLGYSIRCLKD